MNHSAVNPTAVSLTTPAVEKIAPDHRSNRWKNKTMKIGNPISMHSTTMSSVKFTNLPKRTLSHFHTLLQRPVPEVVATLSSLSIITDAKERTFPPGVSFTPTRPTTLSVGTEVTTNNTVTFSGVFSLNNFLHHGIKLDTALKTSFANGRFCVPTPSFTVTVPFFLRDGLHTITASTSQETLSSKQPFPHTETWTPTTVSYTAPSFRLAFTQAAHVHTVHPTERMRDIPHELFAGATEMDYNVELAKTFARALRTGSLTAFLATTLGIYNNHLYASPTLDARLVTSVAPSCWLTSRLYAAGLLAESRVALSQYHYLGGNTLRGFAPRGCAGTVERAHYGGNALVAFAQFVHVRLPTTQPASLFAFANVGAQTLVSCVGQTVAGWAHGAAVGVGLRVGGVELNLTRSLLGSPADSLARFQVTAAL